MAELNIEQIDDISGGRFWSTSIKRVHPKPTDTIQSIAAENGISVDTLVHDNPALKGMAPNAAFGNSAKGMTLVVMRERD